MALQTIQIQLTPEQAEDESFIRNSLAKELNVYPDEFQFRWRKRSIDARKSNIKVNGSFEVIPNNEDFPELDSFHPKNVQNAPRVGIIGAGPAGLFAALQALELGLCPVIFERGKDVRSRRRDLAELNKIGVVYPVSYDC